MINKFEEPQDETTQKMVKRFKSALWMMKDTRDKLQGPQKKYYDDLQAFVDMYDFGSIKHWYEFFKKPHEYGVK